MHGYVCEHVLGCRVAGQLSGSTQLFGVVGVMASCGGSSSRRRFSSWHLCGDGVIGSMLASTGGISHAAGLSVFMAA